MLLGDDRRGACAAWVQRHCTCPQAAAQQQLAPALHAVLGWQPAKLACKIQGSKGAICRNCCSSSMPMYIDIQIQGCMHSRKTACLLHSEAKAAPMRELRSSCNTHKSNPAAWWQWLLTLPTLPPVLPSLCTLVQMTTTGTSATVELLTLATQQISDNATYLSLRSSCAAQHQSLIKTQGCAAVQGCSQNFSEPLPLFPVPCFPNRCFSLIMLFPSSVFFFQAHNTLDLLLLYSACGKLLCHTC